MNVCYRNPYKYDLKLDKQIKDYNLYETQYMLVAKEANKNKMQIFQSPSNEKS